MDIAREICTDSFYTVNGGLPRVPLTAVCDYVSSSKKFEGTFDNAQWKKKTNKCNQGNNAYLMQEI